MLISDFPFVRSVHLLGKRLFGALFPPSTDGWRRTGKEIELPMKKPSTHREQLSPPRSFMGTDRPTDQPTKGERCENSCERIADRLSREISEVESRVVPSSFSVRRHCRRCIFIFISRGKNNISASNKYLLKL